MQRSDQQRKSIELYCKMVAETLNDDGHDLIAVLAKKVIPVSCTQENIKDTVWKAIQFAMYPEAVTDNGKPTTRKLETHQVTKVYECFNRWLGQEFGVHVPWPCDEEMINRQRVNDGR